MNDYYIYIYFDPSRHLEAFYVGKGKGRRSHSHLTRVDHHPFTQRLQKMARNGVIPIIERYEGLDEDAAYDLERALVAEIGRKCTGEGTLLNIAEGGRGSKGYTYKKKYSKEQIYTRTVKQHEKETAKINHRKEKIRARREAQKAKEAEKRKGAREAAKAEKAKLKAMIEGVKRGKKERDKLSEERLNRRSRRKGIR